MSSGANTADIRVLLVDDHQLVRDGCIPASAKRPASASSARPALAPRRWHWRPRWPRIWSCSTSACPT